MESDPLSQVVAVYVSWNTAEELAESLRALLADGDDLEVVVVDNASRDDTVAMLSRDFPAVRVIVNPDNRGFAAAFNQGWRASERRFVLQMNPDTVLAPAALRALVKCLAAHPQVGAVAPLLLDEAGADTENARPFPALTLRRPGVSLPVHGEQVTLIDCADAVQVHWFMGACGLLRREALEATGGFDEGYFLYAEDIDWCLRTWRAGRQIIQLRGVWALHYGNRSAAQAPSWTSTARRYDSYFRYLAQNHGLWAARANFLWWLGKAGLTALALAIPAALLPRLRPRLWHEWGRVRFCLTHLGRPFLLARFGRNHPPGKETVP